MKNLFSCLTHNPVRLAVINVGQTNHCYQLSAGDAVYRLAGVAVTLPEDACSRRRGTGLAAVYQIAEDFGSDDNPVDIVGARSADRLYFRDEQIARITIATDDGSAGFRAGAMH